jgi:thiamine-monophosphate kinase
VTRVPNRPGEFELIARYFAPLARDFPGAYGLRDDAAVIAPAPGHELVVKTDAIVGGVHFFDDDPPALVARKALRVNLSDLAAKGARPLAYLVDLIVPAAIDEAWIAAFAGGLAADQEIFGVHLIGGDTDATPGPVTVAITAFGDVPEGRILRRGGARPGDTVYVTGTIGDAALGLRAQRHGLNSLDDAHLAHLVERYRLPQPRVALGPKLLGIATAALDVSDGLVADLGHLCTTSGVDAIIDEARLPLSNAAQAALISEPALMETVLTGGDDYEIVFAAPPGAADRIAGLALASGVRITAIGRLEALAGKRGAVHVMDEAGHRRALKVAGWQHR